MKRYVNLSFTGYEQLENALNNFVKSGLFVSYLHIDDNNNRAFVGLCMPDDEE